MTSLERLLPVLLRYQVLLKLYHWQTVSYASHKASDDLYGQLSEFIDHLVEYALGVHPVMRIHRQKIDIHDMSDDDITPFLSSLEHVLESITTTDRGIKARRDDLIGYIHQALYIIHLT